MALCQLLQHPATFSQLTMYLGSHVSMKSSGRKLKASPPLLGSSQVARLFVIDAGALETSIRISLPLSISL